MLSDSALDSLDIGLLILVLAIGCPILLWGSGKLINNARSYNSYDKTTVQAMHDNTPEEYRFDRDDFVLALTVADEYQQEPKKIKIGSTTIDTSGTEFLSSKVAYIEKAWSSGLKDANVTDDLHITNVGGEAIWELITE